MPRISDVYGLPSGTKAVTGTTIQSGPYNIFLDDLVTDLNSIKPQAQGGSGSATAPGARTNFQVPFASPSAITDANALSETGFYFTTAATTNIPLAHVGSIYHTQISSTQATQSFISGVTGAISRRYKTGASTWSTWYAEVINYAQATLSTTQNIAQNTVTKALFDTAVLNPNAVFSAGNSRITPPSGVFRVSLSAQFSGNASADRTSTMIYKNGVVTAQTLQAPADFTSPNNTGSVVSRIFQTSGTDYFEAYVLIVSSVSGKLVSGAGTCFEIEAL